MGAGPLARSNLPAGLLAWRPGVGVAASFAGGLAVASLAFLLIGTGGGGAAAPQLSDPTSLEAVERATAALAAVERLERTASTDRSALAERLAAIDTTLRGVEQGLQRTETQAAQAEAAAREAQDAGITRAPGTDRFIAAALHLQASIATARPWVREYRAMVELAPAGALPRTVAEVLGSHAARGVPTEADLRERFATLAPLLLERAPTEGGMLERTVDAMRFVVSAIGLVRPPAPTETELAITGVADQLRRGNLAGAVGDAQTLPVVLQPLLAGWMAQARARLAVEQAVQETLLRALTRGPSPT